MNKKPSGGGIIFPLTKSISKRGGGGGESWVDKVRIVAEEALNVGCSWISPHTVYPVCQQQNYKLI